MGDRAVFGIRPRSEGPTLYLYSHWGGSSQREDLATAVLAAADRLAMDDTSYASRIILSYLIGDDWRRETGYGLSVDDFAWPDYDYVMVADLESKEVITYSVPIPGNGVNQADAMVEQERCNLFDFARLAHV